MKIAYLSLVEDEERIARRTFATDVFTFVEEVLQTQISNQIIDQVYYNI
jgi:hypothetical protein